MNGILPRLGSLIDSIITVSHTYTSIVSRNMLLAYFLPCILRYNHPPYPFLVLPVILLLGSYWKISILFGLNFYFLMVLFFLVFSMHARLQHQFTMFQPGNLCCFSRFGRHQFTVDQFTKLCCENIITSCQNDWHI